MKKMVYIYGLHQVGGRMYDSIRGTHIIGREFANNMSSPIRSQKELDDILTITPQIFRAKDLIPGAEFFEVHYTKELQEKIDNGELINE